MGSNMENDVLEQVEDKGPKKVRALIPFLRSVRGVHSTSGRNRVSL